MTPCNQSSSPGLDQAGALGSHRAVYAGFLGLSLQVCSSALEKKGLRVQACNTCFNLRLLATVAKDIHNNYFHADFTLKSVLHSEPISTDGPFPFSVLFSCDKRAFESTFGHVTIEYMCVTVSED